ncbi:hypothetical protein JW960_18315 [candidate division KSB1 bacterium]|nr:hypothetical protein [candidate division KSB1 bacterium]
MNINTGKTIRLSDFIHPKDKRCLMVDTTITSTLGAITGLEDFGTVLKSINELVDGIIINPGQLEHQAEQLGGKRRATPIVRVDWTNAYRHNDFCLPVSNVKRLMISNGDDAFQLGASAVIASLLLGFNDEFEANNIKELSLLARECHPISMPVIIDIRPIGPKVSLGNFSESIKLGVSFMLELGADALIIPTCDSETYQTIARWISVPVLLRLNEFPPESNMKQMFDAGVAGIVLAEDIFAVSDYAQKIENLKTIIHQ